MIPRKEDISMLGKAIVSGVIFSGCVMVAFGADTSASGSKLTAAQVVERNVTARGGLQAWRGVQSLRETGQLAAGGNDRTTAPVEIPGAKRPGKAMPLPSSPRLKEEAQLPFVMELERPRKLHFEIQFKGQTALQVYDGANGWKLRPYLNRLEVEPYTDDELKLAAMQSELDGPLVDYAAKGTTVELDGMEKVDDHDTYKLKLTLKDGRVTHVWVDAQTFLEAKVEGQPRRLDGQIHPVQVYYRDYRAVNGMQMPFVLETHVVPLAASGAAAAREPHYPVEKISIDKIVVNPKLDASHFAKPQVDVASK
jgi:hypothetical protein